MFNVTPIPAFDDNYIWAISLPEANSVAVVDPGDASPVLTYLEDNDLSLEAILITHHHGDHTGGVETLLNKSGNVPVYGPASSPFGGITNPLKDGDSITLFGHTLEVKEIPGHTLDHISYFSNQTTAQLFCGDTLFLAGCGRLFEGTPVQMLNAMKYFQAMPESTKVYCTHEYSLANLAFAAAVEPENADISSTIDRCKQLRARAQPTLPSSIGAEMKINPFMRTKHSSVIKAAENFVGVSLSDETEVFRSIREWKNQF